MQFNKAQIIIIAVLLSLVGILIYLNFKSSTSEILPEVKSPAETVVYQFDFDAYVASIKDSVNPDLWASLKESMVQADSNEARLFMLSDLSRKFDSLGFPLVGAHYFSKLAKRINDENSWFNAGLRYYEFAATSADTAMQMYATKEAIVAFEKVIALNENNIEAKNALAICYIQNDMDIMKGVQLLKDVTKRDSNNIEANYTLGMLSMRSGQADKAVGRFETLVKLQPMNPEFHYYLGEAYNQMGKKKEALREYETFKTLVPDEGAKKNIEVTINNLKNSN
jgi:tetratricopeptide (TPR) repeat protein